MAGIYVHIPFCKKACHYCNFHFSTSLGLKNEFLSALLNEITLRRQYLGNQPVETIYFGGGTPSLLEETELSTLLDDIRKHFSVFPDAEITLEANPDDINEEKLVGWKKAGINRLSIGVQSFFEEDLVWMNRAHNATQALNNLTLATQYFRNITIDLIYGVPGLTDEKWKKNVNTALALKIPHLSCYALTVEPKTALQKLVNDKKVLNVIPEDQARQFSLLMDWLNAAGYEHYEISNFALPGMRSKHNSSYWKGKHYLGLGPSAHSFNGRTRQWNIANNALYIKSLQQDQLNFEIEELTATQQLNEYIMTSLRTSEGLNKERIQEFGKTFLHNIESSAQKFIKQSLLIEKAEHFILTKEGKLFADGIAADLFVSD